MNKRNEVLKATNNVITKGNSFLSTAKDFITCVEILLIAATGLKEVLEKDNGGDSDE